MGFVSNVVWLTVVLYTRRKPNGKFHMDLKGVERLECITLFTEVAFQLSGNFIYFVLNFARSSGKKNWKCDSEELFERKLVYFVLHYSRKRFFRKGFHPELRNLFIRILYGL